MFNRTSQLQLNLLGPPEVLLGENLVIFPTRKTLALLIYLAIESVPQPRELLSTLFWPESSAERSHASLRNTLGQILNAFQVASGQAATSYLQITHNSLALNPDADIDIDLRNIERAYMQARTDRSSRSKPEGSSSLTLLQSVTAYQRGDFLAGFSLRDAPAFDEWQTNQREIWNRRLGLILDRLSELHFASGEFSEATETASKWISLDTLNESAYRRKMRAHFAAGERGQALETYETCRNILAAELDVEPEPDTEALAARIRSQYPLQRSTTPLKIPITPVAYLEKLFVGRRAEHLLLVERYQLAAAGRPQIVVLRGEAGIGKTRLAREFAAWASSGGAALMQGAAYESGSHLPYQPLVEALRFWRERNGFPEGLLDEAWSSSLSQLLPEFAKENLTMSPDSRKRITQEKRQALEGNGNAAPLFESFVQLSFSLAKHTPLLIFLDDLQWVDSATLDLLQFAVRRWRDSAAQILLLVSLRSEALYPMSQPRKLDGPHGLVQWLAQVERELSPFHLELEPIDEQDSVEMVLSILEPPSADFAQWVYHETRGHPFYLMETLKDLFERGALHPLQIGQGRWAFAVDAEHELGQAVRVPSTVRAVIRSRLNRLSPNAFTLLAAGAVLDSRITFTLLCAIANILEDAALPALDELISSRLLVETAQPGNSSHYAFANDMIRDVVYTEAGDARRRLFHRRSLEVLRDARESSAVLAHHALAAGQAKAAFQHSLAAGRDARLLSALDEAIVHFERARQLFKEASLRSEVTETEVEILYSLLSEAYELVGQPEHALIIKEELDRFQKP